MYKFLQWLVAEKAPFCLQESLKFSCSITCHFAELGKTELNSCDPKREMRKIDG